MNQLERCKMSYKKVYFTKEQGKVVALGNLMTGRRIIACDVKEGDAEIIVNRFNSSGEAK